MWIQYIDDIDFSLHRNMVLQNESADDEFEHFEDIVEDDDSDPKSVPDKRENNSIQSEAVSKSDSDSSEEDDETPASSDDDDVSDEGEEFLVSSNPKVLEKLETVSGSSEQQPKVSSKKSWLPGGYDPRHREPSHWSVTLSYLLLLDYVDLNHV